MKSQQKKSVSRSSRTEKAPRSKVQTPDKRKKKTFYSTLGERDKNPRRANANGPHLELFQRESCPYSHSVRIRLTDLGLDYLAHNVPEGHPSKTRQLKDAGGKDEVPFLIDRRSGVRLYGSIPILNYLENEYGTPAPSPILMLARRIDTRVRARVNQLAWAIRSPWIRAQLLRNDVTDALQTIRGSYRVVRDALTQPSTGPRDPREQDTGEPLSMRRAG